MASDTLTPGDVNEVLVAKYARRLHETYCPTCFPGYADPACEGADSGDRRDVRAILLALAADNKLLG